MKKTFLVALIIAMFVPLSVNALQLGMAGAVKQKVKELDAKIIAKRAADTTTIVAPKSLSGVAARGKAIASAKLSFKDANGALKFVVTGADGKYAIDISTLTLPVVLQITDGTTTYYSVAITSGICNVHPFTDLIVRNWYKAQGGDADLVFASTGVAAIAPPTEASVKAMEATIRSVLSDLFVTLEIDSSNFNLLTSPFNADNSGFDNVLVRTQVTFSTVGITINMVDPTTGNILETILTTSGNLSTTSADDPVAAAAAEINAMFKNSAGLLLSSYLASDYLNDGLDGAAFTSIMSSRPIVSATVGRIVSYDGLKNMLIIDGTFVMSTGATSKTQLTFSKASGSWKLIGNNRIAGSRAEFRYQKTSDNSDNRKYQRFNVYSTGSSEATSISSVLVSGPGISTGMAVPCVADNFSTSTYLSCGNSYGTGTTKAFQGELDNYAPVLGSVYTFTIVRGTSTYTYTSIVKAEFGLDPNGNMRESDFPTITLDNSMPSLPTLLNGTAHTITGSVYLPTWCDEVEVPSFRFFSTATAGSGSFSNEDISGSWTNIAVAGSNANRFTLTIPAMTDNHDGTYTATIDGNTVTGDVGGGQLSEESRSNFGSDTYIDYDY